MHAEPAADRCPRCGQGFHCGANDAGPCPCSTLALDASLLARLRERYTGCLCLHCLQALSVGDSLEPPANTPDPEAKFQST